MNRNPASKESPEEEGVPFWLRFIWGCSLLGFLALGSFGYAAEVTTHLTMVALMTFVFIVLKGERPSELALLGMLFFAIGFVSAAVHALMGSSDGEFFSFVVFVVLSFAVAIFYERLSRLR